MNVSYSLDTSTVGVIISALTVSTLGCLLGTALDEDSFLLVLARLLVIPGLFVLTTSNHVVDFIA